MKRKQVNIHDNAQLCALDMEQASRETRIALCIQIINNELDREDEADEQLIYECSALLQELSPESTMPPEEVEAHLQTFLAQVQTQKKQQTQIVSSHRVTRMLHKLLVRVAVAACLIMMVSVLTVQAHAYTLAKQDKQLYEDALAFNMLSLSEGIGESGKSILTDAQQTVFESMAELFRAYPDLGFYYPHAPAQAPERLKFDIDSANVTYQSKNSWVVVMNFARPELEYLTIQHMAHVTPYTPPGENVTTLESSAREFTVSEITTEEGIRYEAAYTKDNIRYIIRAKDHTVMRLALGSMVNCEYRYQALEQFAAEWDFLDPHIVISALPEGFKLNYIQIKYFTNIHWYVSYSLTAPDGTPAEYLVIRYHEESPPYLEHGSPETVLDIIDRGRLAYRVKVEVPDYLSPLAEAIFGMPIS